MNLSSVQHKLKKWLSFNFAANTNWAATLFHSPKLKYFNRPSTQPPVTMADQHSMNLKPSNRFLGKRTIFYDDEEEQTLTLNRCTVGSNSSSSNQFTSSQSYSYKRHTKWKSRKLESSNTQDFRNWSYSADCDPYDIRGNSTLKLESINFFGHNENVACFSSWSWWVDFDFFFKLNCRSSL